jgi:hypothetical protein
MTFPTVAENDPAVALNALRTDGAVIIRNPDGALADFVALTDEIVETFPHHSVATKERDAVGAKETNVATVNKGTDAIPLHRESSFLPTQPDVVALYCQRPPASGGQTTLCDGVALLAALPEDVRSFLQSEVLSWRFVLPPERWTVVLGTTSQEEASLHIKELMTRYAPPLATYDFTFTDDCLDGTYRAPFVLPTFWGKVPAFSTSLLGYYHRRQGAYVAKHLHQLTISDGRPFPEDMLDVIAACAEKLVVETQWQPGDIVLADNSRVMHGRRAIVDEQRRILARLGRYRADVRS